MKMPKTFYVVGREKTEGRVYLPLSPEESDLSTTAEILAELIDGSGVSMDFFFNTVLRTRRVRIPKVSMLNGLDDDGETIFEEEDIEETSRLKVEKNTLKALWKNVKSKILQLRKGVAYRFDQREKWMEVYNMALENDEKGRRRLHTRRDETVVFQIRITDASNKLGFYWENSCRICGCMKQVQTRGYCKRHSNRDADWKRDHSHPEEGDILISRFEEKVKWMAVYEKVIKEGEEGKYRIHTRRDGTDVFQIRFSRHKGFIWASSCRICGCTSNKARKGGYCKRHAKRDADWKNDHSHPLWKNDPSHPL